MALVGVRRSLLSRPVPSVLDRLFAGGRDGFAYDFTTADGLFQEAAATTPVTQSGHLIGYARDLSGNGNNATSSGTDRPPWNAGGYIAFAGNLEEMATYVEGPAMTMGVSWRPTADDGALGVYTSAGGLKACNLLLDSSGFAGGGWGSQGVGTITEGATNRAGSDGVFVLRGNSSLVGLRYNGADVYGPAAAAGAPWQTGTLALGAINNSGTGFINNCSSGARIYRAIAVEAYLTGAELTLLETWLDEPVGVL